METYDCRLAFYSRWAFLVLDANKMIEVLLLKTVLDYLRHEFLNVLELMSDGVFIADLNYKVHYINTAYGKFTNLKREEIIGKNIYDVRPGGFLPKLYSENQPIYNVPRRVDDTESYCDYLPITVDGRLIGGMVIVKDALRVKELSAIVEENAEKISRLNSAVNDAFSVSTHFADLVGANSGLKSVVELGFKAAKSDSYVLLLGESGTGKDVIAQAIHNESCRKNRPFVDVNCAALPETLLESELFGYVGGAFTGANKHGKTGLFELADGGTIFLDEIAEMPLNLQAKLLRVLQERKIWRIGSQKSTSVDVRVIAATNQDILGMIRQNKFREDLYYRLAVFVINVPALRERKEDIPMFAARFLEDQQKKCGKYIALGTDALRALTKYEWPGNVREFKNTIEYASGFVEGSEITIRDLPQNIVRKNLLSFDIGRDVSDGSLEQIVGEVEREVLYKYLSVYGRDGAAKKKIAEKLNLSVATLYNKIKKYDLAADEATENDKVFSKIL